MRDLFDLYLAAREAEGRAPNTVRNDTWYIGRFLDTPSTPEYPDELHPDHLVRWLATLRRSGLKAGTVAIHQRTVYAWISWLIKRGDLDHDPRLSVKRVQVPEERQHQADVETMLRLRTMLKTDVRTTQGNRIVADTVRNLAIVELLWATAIRPSELCALNFNQVDMRNRVLYLHADQTKRKRARQLPFDPQTKVALTEWLNQRGKHEGPLFTSVDGRRLSYNGLRLMLKRLSVRAGIPVTAYSLRRGGIGHWRRQGVDIAEAMTMAGHKSPVMTLHYSGDAEAEAAIAAYRERIG